MDSRIRYRFAPLAPVPEGRTLRGVLVQYGDVAKDVHERIEPGAFGEVDQLDVVLNMQHQRGRPLTRTGAGLTLRDSAERLEVEAVLPSTRDSDDVLELVKSGVLRGLSAEFVPVSMRREGGVDVVETARLIGLAVVDQPSFSESIITEVRHQQQQPRPLRRFWT